MHLERGISWPLCLHIKEEFWNSVESESESERAICTSSVEFACLCVYMSRRKFETLFFKFKSVVQHHLNIILNTIWESDMANRLLIKDTFLVEIVRIFSNSSEGEGPKDDLIFGFCLMLASFGSFHIQVAQIFEVMRRWWSFFLEAMRYWCFFGHM